MFHLLKAPLFPESFTIACDLPGKYQAKNLKGVIVAAQLLADMGWNINAENMRSALTQVKKTTGLMGRWECLQSSPHLVLDVAHNEHGITAMLDQLATMHYDHLHIVTGMVKDKDVEAVLKLLPTKANYYYTQSNIPRALDSTELAEKGNPLGLKAKCYVDVNNAIQVAKQNAFPTDLILVIGSVYLVAEVDRKLFN